MSWSEYLTLIVLGALLGALLGWAAGRGLHLENARLVGAGLGAVLAPAGVRLFVARAYALPPAAPEPPPPGPRDQT